MGRSIFLCLYRNFSMNNMGKRLSPPSAQNKFVLAAGDISVVNGTTEGEACLELLGVTSNSYGGKD